MKIRIIIFLLLILIFQKLYSFDDPADYCGTTEPITTSINPINDLKAVTIFAFSNEDTITSPDFPEDMIAMKQWMYDIWDTTLEASLTHFYETSSFAKFRITGESYPVGDSAFITDSTWSIGWNQTRKNAIIKYSPESRFCYRFWAI